MSTNASVRLGRHALVLACSVAVLLPALVFHATASAQGAEVPDAPRNAAPETERSPEERSAEAQRLFHEGLRLLSESRYESAGAVLERALQLEARASTAFNLATALHAQGRSWEAHLLLLRVTRREFGALPEGYAETARELRRALHGDLGRIELTYSGEGPATVSIDGEAAGELVAGSALTRVVPPGTHEIAAAAEGFVPVRQRIDVAAGEVRSLSLELVRLGAVGEVGSEDGSGELGREDGGEVGGEDGSAGERNARASARRLRLGVGLGVALAAVAAVVVVVLVTRDDAVTCDGPVGCISF